jgi:hypothetical protein
MKTCKYGCGKMKAGGTKKNYQDGGPTIEDIERKDRRNVLGGLSAKIGLGTAGAGIASIVGKRISDAVKKKKEGNKEVKGMVKNIVKKAKSTKVMQKGGATLPMMGMPMYSNNPRSEQGRILKSGGSTTNRAVAPGCRGGMVKDASGKCVSERPRFKKGGFPDLNKDGKVTKADILKGRGVIKKLGGAKKR